MIRFVVKAIDYAPCAGAGEDPIVELVTVDCEVPDLERLLQGNPRNMVRASLLGVEMLTVSHFATLKPGAAER